LRITFLRFAHVPVAARGWSFLILKIDWGMKMRLQKGLIIAVGVVVGLLGGGEVWGQKTWDGGGDGVNWSSANNWNPNGVPTATDAVTIPNGSNVTVNTAAVCASFTINGGGNANTISISGTNSLTVTGTVTINAGTGSGDNKIIAVGSGTLSCASIVIADTGNNDRDSEITLSTGTVTVLGDITMNGSANRNAIRFSGAGTLNVGGSISGGTIVASTGTVNYNGSSAQTVANYTYYNLTLSGAGAKTLGGDRTITGNLLVEAGATLTLGGNDLDIDINGNRSATINGTLNIDGNGRLVESQGGTKTLILGPGGYLRITDNGGTSIPVLNAYSFDATSTVEYGSTDGQSVSNTPIYGNLVLSGSGTKTFGGAVIVLGELSISGAIANLGTFTSTATSLILGGAYQVTGSWGSTSSPATNKNNTYFSATTGIINVGSGSQTFSTAGSFTFSVPLNVNSITVQAWGGGGGGSTTNGVGGGGGGGAFASSDLSVTPGTSYSVIAGSGGTSGVNGGNSSFANTIVVAAGGSSAANNSSTGGNGGSAAASTGTTKFAGGNGANGSGSNAGGGGGGAGTEGAGGNASLSTGGAGTLTGGGDGGNGRTGSQGQGLPGSTYGGGGGGGYNTGGGSQSGGSGANGQVIISWSSCPKGVWIGVTTDWNDPANWCSGVPDENTDVTIPSTATNMPAIDMAGAECSNITIEGMASLTINDGGVLSVYGNWTNNGTFTAGNNSTVIFTGGEAQSIGGSSSTTFYNLTVNNTSSTGVVLNNSTTVNNQLTLTDGLLILGSNDLTVSGSISGGSGGMDPKYVQTNGAGCLTQPVAAGGAKAFPVGRAAYNPALLALTAGSTTDNFCVRVEDDVYVNGTSGSTVTDKVVERTWFITEGISGGSDATLTLSWNSGETLGTFTPEACYISHFTGGGWNAGPAGNAGAGPVFSRSRSGITSFSPFAVGSAPALPVTWLSFRAALDGDDVKLAWSTASESNNEGFDIQRSENGRDWQTIAFVPGAGTTSEVTNYEYTDPSPFTLHPSLYYRLQQRDYDGTTDYSPVRVIQLEEENAIRVFPNPADEAVTVAFAEPIEKRGTLQLFNHNGRLVAEEVVAPGTSEHTLRVAYLPAGTYALRVVAGAQVWMRRVVVE
jgi:hypothetical protein